MLLGMSCNYVYTRTYVYVGFIGINFSKDTQVPFAIYRIVHMGGVGVASLAAFMPLKIQEITICTFLIVSVCLHLIVNRVCRQ